MGKSGQVIPILFAFEREREEEKIHHRLLAARRLFSRLNGQEKRDPFLLPCTREKKVKYVVRGEEGLGKKLEKADKSGYEEEEANCRGSSLGENVDQSNL